MPVFKRHYPKSHITWLTEAAALSLLQNNPLVDRVLPLEAASVQTLLSQEFDLLINIEKSQSACGLSNQIKAKEKKGFGLSKTGAIVPINREAHYFYLLGLDDEEKFKVNQKTENQVVCEALGFPYAQDEYVLRLTDKEKQFVEDYKKKVGIQKNDRVIGFNTGCSSLFPLKKLPTEHQIELIEKVHTRFPKAKLVLLGGKEDTVINQQIKEKLGDKVIATPTTEGLRRGILYVDVCDVVVSGDTLGLHLAIALKKKTVVWFGLSCPQEIELYGRGKKVLSPVPCSPCWKKECDFEVLCNEVVSRDELARAVEELCAV
jgi:heptosyltransferase-2